jgi:hypothetical protein
MLVQQFVDICKAFVWNQNVQLLHVIKYYQDIEVLRVNEKLRKYIGVVVSV